MSCITLERQPVRATQEDAGLLSPARGQVCIPVVGLSATCTFTLVPFFLRALPSFPTAIKFILSHSQVLPINTKREVQVEKLSTCAE